MPHQAIETEYQVIPVNPRYATIVPVRQDIPVSPATNNPVSERLPATNASPISLFLLGGAVVAVGWLVLSPSPSGPSESQLQIQNAELRQHNQTLQHRVDQLEHQIMGIYSAQ